MDSEFQWCNQFHLQFIKQLTAIWHNSIVCLDWAYQIGSVKSIILPYWCPTMWNHYFYYLKKCMCVKFTSNSDHRFLKYLQTGMKANSCNTAWLLSASPKYSASRWLSMPLRELLRSTANSIARLRTSIYTLWYEEKEKNRDEKSCEVVVQSESNIQQTLALITIQNTHPLRNVCDCLPSIKTFQLNSCFEANRIMNELTLKNTTWIEVLVTSLQSWECMHPRTTLFRKQYFLLFVWI